MTHFRPNSGDKPFGCEFEGCEKGFKAKSHLKEHQMIHLNYK
jgi:uncharacterized Zn-finger protein